MAAWSLLLALKQWLVITSLPKITGGVDPFLKGHGDSRWSFTLNN